MMDRLMKVEMAMKLPVQELGLLLPEIQATRRRLLPETSSYTASFKPVKLLEV